MQMFYGSYSFNANDVSISHIRQSIRADTGYKTGYMDTWTINFRLRADTQAELTTEINNLYSAFGVDGYDLILKDNSGSNSAFITDTESTTSGVRIQNIDFPNVANAQYTTWIDGVITADAETVTSIATNLVYVDSFRVIGNGGPKIVILETATGSPIAQTTRQRTKVTAIQSGSASAIGALPNRAAVLFPNLLVNEQVSDDKRLSIEGGKVRWTREWSYPYQSTQFFDGVPTL